MSYYIQHLGLRALSTKFAKSIHQKELLSNSLKLSRLWGSCHDQLDNKVVELVTLNLLHGTLQRRLLPGML